MPIRTLAPACTEATFGPHCCCSYDELPKIALLWIIAFYMNKVSQVGQESMMKKHRSDLQRAPSMLPKTTPEDNERGRRIYPQVREHFARVSTEVHPAYLWEWRPTLAGESCFHPPG